MQEVQQEEETELMAEEQERATTDQEKITFRCTRQSKPIVRKVIEE
jgi:hypothetical protein